jgi:hypothetical protein
MSTQPNTYLAFIIRIEVSIDNRGMEASKRGVEASEKRASKGHRRSIEASSVKASTVEASTIEARHGRIDTRDRNIEEVGVASKKHAPKRGASKSAHSFAKSATISEKLHQVGGFEEPPNVILK